MIQALDLKAIKEHLFKAKNQVIWVAPSIYEDTALILKDIHSKGIDVKVILDATEETFRRGLGEIKALNILKEAGCDIRESPQSRISFFIYDYSGFFLFNQSRIVEEESKGFNAVAIDALTCQRLLLYYFPPKDIFEATQKFQNIEYAFKQTQNEFTGNKQKLDQSIGQPQIKPLDNKKIKQVEESLKNDPPLAPDLKRKLDVYTNKFQFVELEFIGAQLNAKKISISSDILPIKDVKLKKDLETKLRILEIGTALPEEWTKIKQCTDEIRKEFLVKIGYADKNIIPRPRKQEFTAKVEELKENLKTAKTKFGQFFQEQINQLQNRLTEELKAFFQTNPPDALKYSMGTSFYEESLQKYVSKIILNINYPNLQKELEKVEIIVRYFDVTWEVLHDPKFLKEMVEKELINEAESSEVANIQQAFEQK
jgi:hypothetical protein